MNFWLPYTHGGSGSDVSTRFLAAGLTAAGHVATAQQFHHGFQYFPWGLRTIPAPPNTDAIITNTWNGFVFHRPNAVNITVERLFVLDPEYLPYKTKPQALFHKTLIAHFVRRSILSADICVAVSDYTAKALANTLQVPKPRMILNAVDTDFFSPEANDRRLGHRHTRPFRLLFVGNFTRRKGADLIPEIMKRLGPGFELEFTSGRLPRSGGDNPSNMRCLGRLSLVEVRDAYRRADALLFPSRLEGLPRTVMESLSCGTPVIASDSSSLPEAVDHQHTGLLCPAIDAHCFVAAIKKLAADEALWQQMTYSARETALARFSLRRMVAEYVELVQELRERRQRGAAIQV